MTVAKHAEIHMRPRSILYVALTLLAARTSSGAQSPTCFSGQIRPACSGFAIFEGSAVLSTGGGERTSTTIVPIPPDQGGPQALVNRFHDLPTYFSGSLGYLRVVGPRSAIGGVAELGFNANADNGVAHRVAVTARLRRQYANAALDLGAGPLGVQVFVPDRQPCCVERTIAYGATAEAALLFRGYLGLTAGADLIHGGGRTSGALHVGVRSGSYATVAAAAVLTALGALVLWGLSQQPD